MKCSCRSIIWSVSMEANDWKRIEELSIQAGAALRSGQLNEMQGADAMAFHTLSLCLLDLNDRLARLESPPDKPLVITPYGRS